jgi:hypothetical protein
MMTGDGPIFQPHSPQVRPVLNPSPAPTPGANTRKQSTALGGPNRPAPSGLVTIRRSDDKRDENDLKDDEIPF